MKNNSHDRRLERRANLRKAAAGQLSEADAKTAQTAETARKEAAAKPVVVLNRKQRKTKKAARRKAKAK